MVKQINVVFEEDEFKKLKQAKGELTWKEFILEAAKQKTEEKETGIENAFKEILKKSNKTPNFD